MVLCRIQQLFAFSRAFGTNYVVSRVIRKDSLKIEALLKVGFVFSKHEELRSDEMITYNSYFIGNPAWSSLSSNKL